MPRILNRMQLDGNCFFDTGYVPQTTTGIRALFSFTSTSTKQQRLCGVRDTGTFVYQPIYLNGSGYMAYSPINASGTWTQLSTNYTTSITKLQFNTNPSSPTIQRVTSDRGDNDKVEVALSNDAVTNLSNITLCIGGEKTTSGFSNGLYGLIWEFSIYENNQLVKHYMPAIDDDDNICFYEAMSKTYIYNSGTGTPVYDSIAYTLDDARNVKLDFVEPVWGGTFLTDYYPKANTKVELDFMQRGKWYWGLLMGLDDGTNKFDAYIPSASSGSSLSNITSRYGSGTYTNSGFTGTRGVLTIDGVSKKVLYKVGGTTTTTSITATMSAPATIPMGIFGRNTTSSYNSSSTYYLRFYGCKIYEGSYLKHSYLPWRDSEGVVCLYDEVTHSCLYPYAPGFILAGGTDTTYPVVNYVTTQTKTYKGGGRKMTDDRFYTMRGSEQEVTVVEQTAPVIPAEIGTLDGIVLGAPPTKTTYLEGETFDPTGMIVLAKYSSGATVDVTNLCTCTVADPLTVFSNTVTITYQALTLSVTITVNGQPVAAPTTTTVLAHFDGNLKNEVTGTNLSGTYSQQNGKWNKAQLSANNSSYNTFTTAVNRTNGFTVEFWAKKTDSGTNPIRYGIKGSGTTVSPIFKTSSNITSVGFTSEYVGANSLFNTQTVVTIPTALDTTKFYHYAFVFNTTELRFYLNGQLMTTFGIGTLGVTFNLNYPEWPGVVDEFLACAEEKYVANFEPPHAPYYLPN